MRQIQMGIIPQPRQQARKEWKELAKEQLNYHVDVCPGCNTGKMISVLAFDANGPPAWAETHRNEQWAVVLTSDFSNAGQCSDTFFAFTWV